MQFPNRVEGHHRIKSSCPRHWCGGAWWCWIVHVVVLSGNGGAGCYMWWSCLVHVVVLGGTCVSAGCTCACDGWYMWWCWVVHVLVPGGTCGGAGCICGGAGCTCDGAGWYMCW